PRDFAHSPSVCILDNSVDNFRVIILKDKIPDPGKAGPHGIIGIKEIYVLSFCNAQTAIPRCAALAVGGADIYDPLIPEHTHYFAGISAAAVVNHNQFKVGRVLLKNT